MKTYTKKELSEIIENHNLWLENPEEGSQAMFYNDDLRGYGSLLEGVDLSNARFLKTNLEGALLNGSLFIGADFRFSNLTNAEFSGSNLSGADFLRTNLTKADFRSANLIKVRFNETTLTGIIVDEDTIF